MMQISGADMQKIKFMNKKTADGFIRLPVNLIYYLLPRTMLTKENIGQKNKLQTILFQLALVKQMLPKKLPGY